MKALSGTLCYYTLTPLVKYNCIMFLRKYKTTHKYTVTTQIFLNFFQRCCSLYITANTYYSFSRLLWHIFPITVYFFKTAHTQPITEDEITKTLFDVCRMTPLSQNHWHKMQNPLYILQKATLLSKQCYVTSKGYFVFYDKHRPLYE